MSRKEILFGYAMLILAPPVGYAFGGPVGMILAGVLGIGCLVAAYKQDEEKEGLLTAGTLFGDVPVFVENDGQTAGSPDVALVWDWSADEKKVGRLLGRTEKSILVHNRSDQYVYNVQITPIRLINDLVFDAIPEIAPGVSCRAVGRWRSIELQEMTSSSKTNYAYYFCPNEQEAAKRGWFGRKPHNRGIGDSWFQIPMSVKFSTRDNARWLTEFEFTYDVGYDSHFKRVAGRKI